MMRIGHVNEDDEFVLFERMNVLHPNEEEQTARGWAFGSPSGATICVGAPEIIPPAGPNPSTVHALLATERAMLYDENQAATMSVYTKVCKGCLHVHELCAFSEVITIRPVSIPVATYSIVMLNKDNVPIERVVPASFCVSVTPGAFFAGPFIMQPGKIGMFEVSGCNTSAVTRLCLDNCC